jgi:hypothetical protein
VPAKLPQLLVVVLVGWGACRGAAKPSDSVEAAAAAGPRLKLALSRLELGAMVQDQVVRKSIAMVNTGTRPLTIERIAASMFCSGTAEPNALAPGARGEVRVTCRSDTHGSMREQLTIHSNDPQAPQTPIQLVAEVTPLLGFDARLIDRELPFGATTFQDVRLVGTLVDKSKVQFQSPDLADVAVSSLPAQLGEASGFRVLCKGRKVGRNTGDLHFSTGLPRPNSLTLPYICKVEGTLSVTPTNPYFNLKEPGAKAQFVEVRSSQPGFKIESVEIREGPFQASVEPGNPTRVKVMVAQERIAPETRGVTGTLVIHSNDRTEPRKEIPLFGMGRINRN